MNIKAIEVQPGDIVKVYQKGHGPFEGIVIARRGGNSPSATFCVRAVLSGVGVEKIYPIHSPTIEKLEIKKKAKARQSKLYYLRKIAGIKRLKLKSRQPKEIGKKDEKKTGKKKTRAIKKTKDTKTRSRNKANK